MVAVDADHVAQAVLDALLERRVVLGIGRIRAGVPKSIRRPPAHAPETIFRPKKNPQLVARVRERRVMRIMRAADELEACVLHQFHVPEKSAVGHRVAPAGVILVHIRALEIQMLAVQEKSLLGSPLEPAEAERRGESVGGFAAVGNLAHRRVEKRMVNMPELRTGDRRGGLVKRHR